MKKVIPAWLFNRIKEKFPEVIDVNQVKLLTDDQLLSVPMFGKMRLQRLRLIKDANNTEWIEGYNAGIKEALRQAAKLSTDNFQKCITYRECEILMLEEKLLKS